jgi:hypothetical protein
MSESSIVSRRNPQRGLLVDPTDDTKISPVQNCVSFAVVEPAPRRNGNGDHGVGQAHDQSSPNATESSDVVELLDVEPRPRTCKVRSGKLYQKAMSVKNLKPAAPAPADGTTPQPLADAVTDTIQTCYVQVVTGLTDAMNPNDRRRREFRGRGKFVARVRGRVRRGGGGDQDGNGSGGGADNGNGTPAPMQYRLTSAATSTDMEKSFDPSNSKWTFLCVSVSKSMGIVDYVRWSYQASFAKLALSLTVIFYTLVTIFAVLIYLVGIVQPQCIYVGSIGNFKDGGEYFIDAFSMSWTTFATVVCRKNERAIDGVLCVHLSFCPDDDIMATLTRISLRLSQRCHISRDTAWWDRVYQRTSVASF